tara:strand:- start:38 stop:1861 length:1824 start_codon:yes stop_codon:yes gene_type:complete
MKTFTKFLTLSEDITKAINSLCEANVHEPRYAYGSEVVLKTPKIDSFSKALVNAKIKKTVDGNTIFKKIEPKKNLPTVTIGKDKTIITFLSFGKTEFKLIGYPHPWFNQYASRDGINWGTPQMETAACIGLFLNGVKMAKEIADGKNVQAWKDKIVSVLGKNEDWFDKGKDEIINGMGKISIADLNSLAAFASGMTTFKKAIIPFKTVHLIHGRIGQYYGAERENQSVEGNKDNTADVIVSDSSAEKTIEAMGSKKAKYSKKNGQVTVGDVKLFQVSLKKSITGAQLGKITKNVLDRYGISSDILYNTVIESNDIDEGFMSWIKDVGKKVLDVFQQLYSKLKQKFLKVTNTLLSASSWQKQANKDEKEFAALGIEGLAECFEVSNNEMVLNESMLVEKKNDISKNLKAMKPANKKKLLGKVNKRLGKLKKTFKPDSLVFKQDGDLKKFPSKADDIFKLFSNYVSMQVVDDVMGGGDYNDEKLVKEIIDLQREMYFGRTELPLWKVYGAITVGDTNTYSYLSTGKEFVNKKIKRLSGKEIILCGFRANLNASKVYFTMQCSFILGINDDGTPNYNLLRTGTNTAGKYSFVVEGTKEHDYEYFIKAYMK